MRGDIKLTRKGPRGRGRASCGATGWRSVFSPTFSACRGMRFMPRRACSSTRSRERVEERLVAMLGDPQTCPHGHPIPPQRLDASRCAAATRSHKIEPGEARSRQASPSRCRRFCATSVEIGLRPGAQAARRRKGAARWSHDDRSLAERAHAISLELARMVMIA